MKLIGQLVVAGLGLLGLGLFCGCGGKEEGGADAGVLIGRAGLEETWQESCVAIAAAPVQAVNGPGLVGVMGGARVKLMKPGVHEVWLPCPQADAVRVPKSFGITTVPAEAGKEFRFREREGGNRVVVVKLELPSAGSGPAGGQEVQIEWAAMLLVSGKKAERGRERGKDVDEYLKSTACAQAADGRITELAGELWDESAGFEGYARTIQEHIRNMKQGQPVRSMDAVGLLDSGANWICTANANLAVALMRANGVPARSLAWVPTTGQKLEMHRVLECFTDGHWVAFDPSSLQPAIPLQPWHGAVMARTTIADEQQAMKPRMGVSLGCPVGQELEFTGPGIAFAAKDFFWTKAKMLKEYEVPMEELEQARREWADFLETGK